MPDTLILTNNSNYEDIADAIRSKTGASTTFKPDEMAQAILDIPVNGTVVSATTATATDVKAGKVFFNSSGTRTVGTLNFNWMGENPELVSQVYTYSTTLDKTSYNGWTPSTTAKTIKATETLTTKPTLDLQNYDYILLWISDVQVAYNNQWVATKGSPLRQVCMRVQHMIARPASVAAIQNYTYNYNDHGELSPAINWLTYYSSASAISVGNQSYGFYMSAINAGSFSSTSAASPTYTIKTPTFQTRCNSNYFTTAVAAQVDQENTTVKLNGYLYRVKAKSLYRNQWWTLLTDVYNDPL